MILQQADTEFGKPVMADLALTGLCQAHGAEAKRLDHNAGFCTPQPDATGDDRMLRLGVSAPPASGKPFAMSSAPSAARNWSAPPTVASSTSQVTTVRVAFNHHRAAARLCHRHVAVGCEFLA